MVGAVNLYLLCGAMLCHLLHLISSWTRFHCLANNWQAVRSAGMQCVAAAEDTSGRAGAPPLPSAKSCEPHSWHQSAHAGAARAPPCSCPFVGRSWWRPPGRSHPPSPEQMCSGRTAPAGARAPQPPERSRGGLGAFGI